MIEISGVVLNCGRLDSSSLHFVNIALNAQCRYKTVLIVLYVLFIFAVGNPLLRYRGVYQKNYPDGVLSTNNKEETLDQLIEFCLLVI